jgi:hypothetical protein
MVGTLSLYDAKGERLHTQYMGESPENGKERFYNRFTEEIGCIRGLMSWPIGQNFDY